MPHPLACDEDSKQTLPAEADDRIGRRHVGPFARQLVGDRSEEPCAGVVPRRRQRPDEQWVGWRTRDLYPTLGCLDVLEHRAALERDDPDVDSGKAEEVELGRRRRLVVRPDECRGSEAEPGDRQGRVRHAAAESPAAAVVSGDVPAGRADDHDGRDVLEAVVLRAVAHRAIYWTSVGLRDRRSLPHTESERVFLRTP